MSDEVRRQVVAAIRERGPITFADYMAIALDGPGGFYERPPVGVAGDFVTSPHVHPVFGELLGRGIHDLWEALDRPAPFRVVEVGAGDGTLARLLMGTLTDLPLAYTAVETSSGAREALRGIDGVEVRSAIDDDADLVLAHELLDNLPFRVLRGAKEVRVGLLDGELAELEVPVDMGSHAWFEGGDDGDGDTIVPVGAVEMLDAIAAAIPRGAALVIDYGDVGSPGGPRHGYRGHRVVADLLADPGGSDITAGVDFGLLARLAVARGLEPHGPISQHDALIALGLEGWIRGELRRQHELLDARAGLEAVRTWSGRSRATLLADPAGLGRLRWLLLARPGTRPPPWLSDRA